MTRSETIRRKIKSLAPDALHRSWARVQASPLGLRLVSGVFWSMSGTVLAQVLTMALAIITARMLGKEGFGELSVLGNTTSLFATFAGIGLGMTSTKYIAEFRRTDPARAGRIVGLSAVVVMTSSAVLGLLMFALAPVLANQALNAPQLVTGLRISSFMLFFSTVIGAQTGVFMGLESFKTIAYLNVLDGLIRFPLTLAGLYLGQLTGVVIGQTLATGIVWLVSFIVLRIEMPRAGIAISYRGLGRELSVIWNYSVPLLISSVMVGPIQWVVVTFLAHQPRGYDELGLWSACKRADTLLLFLPGIFMRVAMPMMSSAFGEGSGSGKDQSNKIMMSTFSLTVAVIFPAGVALMFGSDLFMMMFGRDFSAGAVVLVGVVMNDLMIGAGTMGGTFLQAQGRMWLGFAINLVWGLLYVLIVWLSVARFGANSLAFGSAVSFLILNVGVYAILWSYFPPGTARRVIYASFLAAGLAAASAPLTPALRLTLCLPVLAVTTYLVVFKLVDPETRELFWSHFREPLPPGLTAAPEIPPGGKGDIG